MKRAWQRFRPPSGWTLRTRLVATMIALLALVSLVVSLVSVLVVNKTLLASLDAKLGGQGAGPPDGDFGGPPGYQQPTATPSPTSTAVPTGGATSAPTGESPAHRGYRHQGAPPGIQVGTISVLLVGCASDTGGLTIDIDNTADDTYTEALTQAQCDALNRVPVDRRRHTVDLPGLGKYRVLILPSQGDTRGARAIGLPLSEVTDTVYRLAAVMTVVSLLGLLLAGMIGAATVRWTLRPLHRVAATAGRVAELPLDRGEVALGVRVPDEDTDARTEVGQVGAALNRMLGHVANALSARQASEARVRKFVADASHELRTPLASIRGYAELTRRDRGAVPPQVAHALTRVESEAVRMTGLVEDLLLLARLDAGRPVERRPVDLSAMVVDAVSDAHAAGPSHRWNLDLPDDPVVISGDQSRLHQVIANLLANARTHTPTGTEVTVRLTLADDVLLQVIDDGPGIPPDLLPEVFERFTRADVSRSRATGSTGLGLAIVAAVVEAHHGTVAVDSTPGRTVFTVHLPRNPTPAPTPVPTP